LETAGNKGVGFLGDEFWRDFNVSMMEKPDKVAATMFLLIEKLKL
jgi:hypothetical protein